MVLTSKEVAMTDSMISFVVGIVVVLCIVVITAARYRREHKDQPGARWLHAHPIKDWLHHKH
jgi:heme/copper-type cytochrome/quinol oxidase subunit 2